MKNGICLIFLICSLGLSAQAWSVWVCTQSGSGTDVINSDDQTVCDNLCSGIKDYHPTAINTSRDMDTLKKYCAQTAGSPSDLENNWLACEYKVRALPSD